MRPDLLDSRDKTIVVKPLLFLCSGCGDEKARTDFHEANYNDRKREVTSRCRDCRREDYHSKRYPTVCIQCMHHRPLDLNRTCRGCNEDNGFRQCLRCNELLPTFVEFRGTKRTCETCLATPRQASQPASSSTA